MVQGDVKQWMREHKREVEVVQKRYDELKELGLAELVEMVKGANVSRVRDELIKLIIAKG